MQHMKKHHQSRYITAPANPLFTDAVTKAQSILNPSLTHLNETVLAVAAKLPSDGDPRINRTYHFVSEMLLESAVVVAGDVTKIINQIKADRTAANECDIKLRLGADALDRLSHNSETRYKLLHEAAIIHPALDEALYDFEAQCEIAANTLRNAALALPLFI
jgi:hypothetical protein